MTKTEQQIAEVREKVEQELRETANRFASWKPRSLVSNADAQAAWQLVNLVGALRTLDGA